MNKPKIKEVKTINIKIDDRDVSVPEGTTVMEAAEKIGIQIPRLCYHPDLSLQGSCRVCIVEVKGFDFYMTSCSTKVWEGMEIKTNSPEIRRARRDIVELLLDNHPQDCQTCERDGNCELQNLSYSLGVRERLFSGERKRFPEDKRSKSVVRVPEKCILCGRCVRVCAEVQGVYNLSQHGRGFNTQVMPAHGSAMDESVCIQCGQCIMVCPVAAFIEQSHTEKVWNALADPKKHVVIQTAPSIRAAIGEGFGMEPGTPATGKMVTALRLLGFDAIFDTNFGADLTIVEEATEFLKRIQKKERLPLLTSCSPGWINFLEKFYPEMIPFASTCRSPMSMTSVLLKTYYAEKIKKDPKDVFVVAVMPCVAKKYEADRDEHKMADGTPYTDAVLTTRELIWMIKCYGIDLKDLPDSEFDNPLGESSGAADIFGTTGGVMEAALRMACEVLTGLPPEKMEFTDVRAVEGLRETEVTFGNYKINVAVSNGLTNAKTILNRIISGEKQYHIVEIMACPGGCIGGGGQPYPPEGYHFLDPELLAKRAQALYKIDSNKNIRSSNHNPSIQQVYREFLGAPGSERAHQLLHTHYHPRLPRGIR
ncbi:MAG TPA: NADH-dependent [FeFe] hydrogenase, group A6 [Candidatus Hydrogenedens sp.]|nr:NADH-dependent [FeFe] hydrogenase, group A6 [Candidatus Hydrogenedens sp.]HOL20751.1 NADH-dependent [FeFe] hydrogenase, group A6 [Candidatus Hydrogenedens sp.]